MVSPPDRRSARAIINEDAHVALIERTRRGDHFFVFPGGSVEPGESSYQAVVREVVEELGLMIRPSRIVAEDTFPDRVQDFWLAEIVDGEFGTGTGPEMAGCEDDRDGSRSPTWMSIADIHHHEVYPVCVVAELLAHHTSSWPTKTMRFTDSFMWWLPD